MLIDTHAHLNDDRLLPRVDEIVSGLAKNGLERVLVVGYDFQSSKKAVELAGKYGEIYAVVGCHPHDSKSYGEEEEAFYRSVADNAKVVAIGEIGLDYHYDLSPRETQREIFVRQLRLADELKLPVVLHVREAYGDALTILSDNAKYLNSGILLHCYSGSAEMVREFNRFDCYYSFGGTITYKNANKGEVLSRVPQNRLLLETDCPYLAPVPKRGTDNEPKYIDYTLHAAAALLDMRPNELADITSQNAKNLFIKLR